MEKTDLTLAIEYSHEPIGPPDENGVHVINFQQVGLVGVLEVVYPCILPHHQQLHYTDYITVIYSFSPEVKEMGTTKLYIASAGVPIDREIISKNTAYIGHVTINDEVLFVGAEQIKYAV